MSNENKQPDERAAFEVWWVRDVPQEYRYSVLERQRFGNGYLKGTQIYDAWEVWQAARATTPHPVAVAGSAVTLPALCANDCLLPQARAEHPVAGSAGQAAWLDRTILDIAKECAIVGAPLARLAHVIGNPDLELLKKLTTPISQMLGGKTASTDAAPNEGSAGQACQHDWRISSNLGAGNAPWVCSKCGASDATPPIAALTTDREIDVEGAMKAALGDKYCPVASTSNLSFLSPTSADYADLKAEGKLHVAALTTDAGAVLTDAQREAIEHAVLVAGHVRDGYLGDVLNSILASHPTERVSDAAREGSN